MHEFKSALHYIKYYKLVLNAFLIKTLLSRFLKVPKLLQDLISTGYEFHKAGAV